MAISSEVRRAGPYIGTGAVSAFPFSFKTLQASHIKVVVSDDGSMTEDELPASAFSVSLNSDQDNNPGGTVELFTPLEAGKRMAILSNVPYLQPMVLTNRGGFYPDMLNDSADSIVIMTQQLREELSRTLRVPASSDRTAEDLVAELLAAQEDAKKYAGDAAASAEEVRTIAEELTNSSTGLAAQIQQEGERQVEAITNAGSSQIDSIGNAISSALTDIRQEGDYQVNRITQVGESSLWESGLASMEQTWVVSEAIEADAAITIPDGMQYMVGRHHLRISWNGLALFPGENFDEVGEADAMSSTIKIHFALSAGDVLDAWVASLGAGSVSEAIQTANAASDAVAELSRKVVYKDAESAS